MKKFIGVKIVDAEPMTLGAYNRSRGWTIPADEDPEKKGFRVVYKDGYASWCPKGMFDDQNLPITGNNNKITQADVDGMIADTIVRTIGEKTTFVQVTLLNGFVLTESSACVDSANYDVAMGRDICLEKIKDKIWFLLGFLLQSAVYGFGGDLKCEPIPPKLTNKKTLNVCEANGARKVIKDIEIVGNGDMFQLLCKASSKSQGWMKSCKAMKVPYGCVVQVTTQQGDHVAEALTFVPSVTITDDINGGRKLV